MTGVKGGVRWAQPNGDPNERHFFVFPPPDVARERGGLKWCWRCGKSPAAPVHLRPADGGAGRRRMRAAA